MGRATEAPTTCSNNSRTRAAQHTGLEPDAPKTHQNYPNMITWGNFGVMLVHRPCNSVKIWSFSFTNMYRCWSRFRNRRLSITPKLLREVMLGVVWAWFPSVCPEAGGGFVRACAKSFRNSWAPPPHSARACLDVRSSIKLPRTCPAPLLRVLKPRQPTDGSAPAPGAGDWPGLVRHGQQSAPLAMRGCFRAQAEHARRVECPEEG